MPNIHCVFMAGSEVEKIAASRGHREAIEKSPMEFK